MKKTALIIIGGFAGAGKTTAAKKLSALNNLPLVSTDELNDELRKILQCDFKTASPHAHDLAWAIVQKYLENGTSVILDTNMCHDRTWKNVDDLTRRMPDIDVLPIILQCSLETHRQRIEERGRTNALHLNLGGDDFEDIIHKYEYIESLKREDLIRINAEASVDEVYRNIVSYLEDVRRPS